MSIMYKSENNSDGPESFMNFEFFAVFMNAQVDTYVADTNDAKLQFTVFLCTVILLIIDARQSQEGVF